MITKPRPLPNYKLISYKKWKNKLLPEGSKYWYGGQWHLVPVPSTSINETSIVSIPEKCKGHRKVVFEENNHVETIRIKTHCPEKWLLIDRETGECWKWDNGKLITA